MARANGSVGPRWQAAHDSSCGSATPEAAAPTTATSRAPRWRRPTPWGSPRWWCPRAAVTTSANGGLTLSPRKVERILKSTAREKACPEPRTFTYPDPDLTPDYTAVCRGRRGLQRVLRLLWWTRTRRPPTTTDGRRGLGTAALPPTSSARLPTAVGLRSGVGHRSSSLRSLIR